MFLLERHSVRKVKYSKLCRRSRPLSRPTTACSNIAWEKITKTFEKFSENVSQKCHSLITEFHIKEPKHIPLGCNWSYWSCLWERCWHFHSPEQAENLQAEEHSLLCTISKYKSRPKFSFTRNTSEPATNAITMLMKNWEHPMEFLTELTQKFAGGNFKPILVLQKNFSHLTWAKMINEDLYNPTLRTRSCWKEWKLPPSATHWNTVTVSRSLQPLS